MARWGWVAGNESPQARDLEHPPPITYWSEPVTAPIPNVIGDKGLFRAPPAPSNMPRGVQIFVQYNGRDVAPNDPSISRYSAPSIPRVGGSVC